MCQVHHIINRKSSNDSNEGTFNTSKIPSHHDHGAHNTDQHSHDTKCGKEGKVKDTCTDQEYKEGDSHTKDATLNCRLDIDRLIIHEYKLFFKISHDDGTTAAFRYDLILLFCNGDELFVLDPSNRFGIKSKWIKDVTLGRNGGKHQVKAIPPNLIRVSFGDSFPLVFIEARLLIQKFRHDAGELLGVDLPSFVLPFALAYIFAVSQITLDIVRGKFLNETVYLSQTILALNEILVLRICPEFVAKGKKIRLTLFVEL
mmetsp:Transcript_41122/g.74147  ORF Transcript_41122/g.74147 Transcript_41122/m.74147 type:complete len:258 (-) Transcript_41122:2449-3222(-)